MARTPTNNIRRVEVERLTTLRVHWNLLNETRQAVYAAQFWQAGAWSNIEKLLDRIGESCARLAADEEAKWLTPKQLSERGGRVKRGREILRRRSI